MAGSEPTSRTSRSHRAEFHASEVLTNGRIYSCHTIEEAGAWSYPPHLHVDCCDLTYVYRGELNQQVNGTSRTLSEGSVTLVRPGDTHWPRGRHVVLYNLNFRPRTLASAGDYLGLSERIDAMLQSATPPVFAVPLPARSRVLLELQQLLLGQHEPNAAVAFRGFLARWLSELTGPTDAPTRTTMPAWMGEVLRAIETDVERPITVADLVRLSGRSGAHIARSFRHHLDTTPSAAINDARIRRAALLLAHTNRSILDIAYGLGFSNASYFYRLFRSAHGASPRRYRIAHAPLRGAAV
ncbi:MAG: AraC family transcriptional regulator [Spirochaetaceae bacterium]|nr:MAG: AraC family transcriptional regulator [Spirochaetaceae bacterium]